MPGAQRTERRQQTRRAAVETKVKKKYEMDSDAAGKAALRVKCRQSTATAKTSPTPGVKRYFATSFLRASVDKVICSFAESVYFSRKSDRCANEELHWQ
jgi:hypothetical protein